MVYSGVEGVCGQQLQYRVYVAIRLVLYIVSIQSSCSCSACRRRDNRVCLVVGQLEQWQQFSGGRVIVQLVVVVVCFQSTSLSHANMLTDTDNPVIRSCCMCIHTLSLWTIYSCLLHQSMSYPPSTIHLSSLVHTACMHDVCMSACMSASCLLPACIYYLLLPQWMVPLLLLIYTLCSVHILSSLPPYMYMYGRYMLSPLPFPRWRVQKSGPLNAYDDSVHRVHTKQGIIAWHRRIGGLLQTYIYTVLHLRTTTTPVCYYCTRLCILYASSPEQTYYYYNQVLTQLRDMRSPPLPRSHQHRLSLSPLTATHAI